MNHKLNSCLLRHVISNTKKIQASQSVKNLAIDKLQCHSVSRCVSANTIFNNLCSNEKLLIEKNSPISSLHNRHLHITSFQHNPTHNDALSTPIRNSFLHQIPTIPRRQLFSSLIHINPFSTPVRWFKSSHPCNSDNDVKIVNKDNQKNKDEGDKKSSGIIKKFKQMWKDYWYVVIPVHIVTSIGWYGGFYLLIKSGVDIPGILQWMGTSQAYVEKLSDSNLGVFALMLACYKIATPIRYTVTVGGSTWTVRYLNKKGYMTTSEMKEELTDRSDHLKKLDDKLQHTKTQIIDWKEGIRDEYERAWVSFAKRRNKK